MTGWDGLLQKLEAVKVELRQQLLQNAVNAGARVIRDEARARVSVRSGLTRNAIRTFVRRTGVGRNEVSAGVGLRGGGKNGRIHIGRFLEFGTTRHVIEPKTRRARRKEALLLSMGQVVRKVDHPGIAPKPFLRPAFDAKSQAALDAMAKSLGRGIEKAIRKGGGV